MRKKGERETETWKKFSFCLTMVFSFFIPFYYSLDHVLHIEVFTRRCRHCFLVYQPQTLSMGLLVVGPNLVSLDCYYMMETMCSKGFPPLTAASSVIAFINDRTSYFEDKASEESYVEGMLRESFYSYYTLKLKVQEPIVCLLCGTIPGCCIILLTRI